MMQPRIWRSLASPSGDCRSHTQLVRSSLRVNADDDDHSENADEKGQRQHSFPQWRLNRLRVQLFQYRYTMPDRYWDMGTQFTTNEPRATWQRATTTKELCNTYAQQTRELGRVSVTYGIDTAYIFDKTFRTITKHS